MIQPKIKMAIFEHAKEVYPHECAGLITQKGRVQKYHAIDNVAADPENQCVPDEKQYGEIMLENEGKVVAFVHSHTGDGATTIPSAHDVCMCNEFEIPFVIVSLPEGDLRVIEPTSTPLIGRPWSLGSYDCWGLIMSFHKLHGVELNDFRKPYEWWKEGEDLYAENWQAEGFEEVYGPPRFGDMIIFQLQSPVWNHAGIYVGNNEIIHHLQGRLSSVDLYSGWYEEKTVLVCRHKDLKHGIIEKY
ncbi:tail assembly protein [Klebsiella phage KL3]|nr:tail assembly protein [Klebsiella phage KL3]